MKYTQAEYYNLSSLFIGMRRNYYFTKGFEAASGFGFRVVSAPANRGVSQPDAERVLSKVTADKYERLVVVRVLSLKGGKVQDFLACDCRKKEESGSGGDGQKGDE